MGWIHESLYLCIDVSYSDPFFSSGEKLSKQQLQNSNIIKKLRAKEKDRENTHAKQSKKIKELEEELQHLKQVR